MTAALLALADWLLVYGCAPVVIGRTGDDWTPVFNRLGGTFAVLLVKAQRVKAVPGRKTDVNDAAWLAQLLPHGLWRASFIPRWAGGSGGIGPGIAALAFRCG
jgi:transposase